MELDAIEGRSQRGISFVHPSVTTISTAQLSYEGVTVFTDIRTSERIASGSIVIDSRIFNELGCEEHNEVTLTAVPEVIPDSSELTLLVDSLEGLENTKAVDALSRRIDDLKDHLDGLIVRMGQRIDITELGIGLIVDDSKPVAEQLQASRIMWDQLLKVNLAAQAEFPSCFNLCCVVDVGASSGIEDVEMEDGTAGITRFEASLCAIKAILSSAKECDDALVSAVAFGESSVELASSEGSILQLSSESYQPIHDWLCEQNNDRNDEPSNPGSAMDLSIGVAHQLKSRNGLPALVIFVSGGAFTSGRNPVITARRMGASEGIFVTCVALGTESDMDLMQAIAVAGKGSLIHIDKFKEITSRIERIFDRIDNEVVDR
ncbi:MAG: hypothetical protein ACFFFC_05505 [Candidatus Thorarchaeota archaeon]